MNKQQKSDVEKYILDALRKKYGTYAGYDHCGNIEILNDEDTDRVIISVANESDMALKNNTF